MTLAMKRLKNIGWLALVFMVAVLLYPLSLNVAALHSDLSRIDRDILETKQEINFLQAEIRTRASVAQLEEWNQLLYGYEPPRADQFIDGDVGFPALEGTHVRTRSDRSQVFVCQPTQRPDYPDRCGDLFLERHDCPLKARIGPHFRCLDKRRLVLLFWNHSLRDCLS